MAVILGSAIVDKVRGSVGGVSFGSSKGGDTVFTRPLQVGVGSAQQERFRAAYAEARKRWMGLDAVTRSHWVSAGYQVTLPNRVGKPQHLSGLALYVREWVWPIATNTVVGLVARPWARISSGTFEPAGLSRHLLRFRFLPGNGDTEGYAFASIGRHFSKSPRCEVSTSAIFTAWYVSGITVFDLWPYSKAVVGDLEVGEVFTVVLRFKPMDALMTREWRATYRAQA
jgi:hypothetical protein